MVVISGGIQAFTYKQETSAKACMLYRYIEKKCQITPYPKQMDEIHNIRLNS